MLVYDYIAVNFSDFEASVKDFSALKLKKFQINMKYFQSNKAYQHRCLQ